MSAVSFLGMLIYSGASNGQNLLFYVGVALAGAMLLHHLSLTDIDRPEDCKRLFLGTPRIGLVILTGLVADAAFQRTVHAIPL